MSDLRVDWLEDRLAEALAVLRELEWSFSEPSGYWCPYCAASKEAGHTSECKLAKVLHGP